MIITLGISVSDVFITDKFWLLSILFTNLFGYIDIIATPQVATSRVYYSWASCQMHKIAGCACAGDAGNVFPGTAG